MSALMHNMSVQHTAAVNMTNAAVPPVPPYVAQPQQYYPQPPPQKQYQPPFQHNLRNNNLINHTNNVHTKRQGEDTEDEQDADAHKADTDVAHNNMIEVRILHINLHITLVKVGTNNNTNRPSTHTIPTPQKGSLTRIIAGPTATISLMPIIATPVSNQQ